MREDADGFKDLGEDPKPLPKVSVVRAMLHIPLKTYVHEAPRRLEQHEDKGRQDQRAN